MFESKGIKGEYMETKYLIIGNGIAGNQAAKTIRKKDPEGKIVIVAEESYPTYQRVKLTHALGCGEEIEKMLVDKSSSYKEKKIRLILSKKVKEILFQENKAVLDGNQEISYEKLLIATGSNPIVPPYKGEFLDNIMILRRYGDLELLRNKLKFLDKIAVVGGGLLGLELAYSLAKLGKSVDVIELAPYLLNRQLDEKNAKKLEEDLKDYQITAHTGVCVDEVCGYNSVEKLILNNGEELVVDALVFSIGVKAETSLVKEKLEVNRGIVVDKHLKTSLDNVWAAGDCAEFEGRTMGLWLPSSNMGKVAGANMAGDNIEYEPGSLFTSLNIGDIKIFSAGKITDDSEVLEKNGQVKTYFFEDDILVGGILYGDTKDMMKINKAIGAKATRKDLLEISE